MFFKHAYLYQISCPAADVIKVLKEKIATREFTPCTKSILQSAGFVPPFEDSDELWAEQAGCLLVKLKHQVKQIPPAGVAEMLAEKVAELEEAQDRKIYRKERLVLKSDIIMDLTPAAIPVSKYYTAYIDTRLNMLVVNTGTASHAENVVSALRDAMGSLPVLLPVVNNSPERAMTEWLHHRKFPADFKRGDSCRLAQPGDDGGSVTIKKDDLASEGIDALLDEGRVVESLQIRWRDGDVTFTMGTPYVLKSLEFSEQLISSADQDGDDERARLEADLTLMVDTMRGLVPDIGKAFGGWCEQAFLDLGGAAQ